MSEGIPGQALQLRSLVTASETVELSLEDVAVPTPGPRQVVVRVETAIGAGAAFSRYGSSVHKQVYIYGGLDRGPTQLTRRFGMAWGVGGWLLTSYLQKAGPENVARMRERVAAGLTTTFASQHTDEVTLAGALRLDAMAVYERQATGKGKKYLITPNG